MGHEQGTGIRADNFRREAIDFEVVDWKSQYHAILGRPEAAWAHEVEAAWARTGAEAAWAHKDCF